MKIDYLVTTNVELIPVDRPIAMLDGTVPKWQKAWWDMHYDHHRPGGGKVQIDEMPKLNPEPYISYWMTECDISENMTVRYSPLFITTQVDADACVAAAWLQLTDRVSPENQRKLRAIALDCDYLCIPPSESEQDLAEFAAKAVAALKESTRDLPQALGLPVDRKTWTEGDKVRFASECFRLGTEWLIAAANGNRPFPGESGEADSYFERMKEDTAAMRQLGVVRLVEGCAVFDQRSISKYVDPRCLVTIARELGATGVVTLSVRSMPVELCITNGSIISMVQAKAEYEDAIEHGSTPNHASVKIPGFGYTLGSLPYHDGAAALDLTQVFPVLAKAEQDRRKAIGFPAAETTWGGRASVGGSGWRDASLLQPEEVIAIALNPPKEQSLLEKFQAAAEGERISCDYPGFPYGIIIEKGATKSIIEWGHAYEDSEFRDNDRIIQELSAV